MSWFPLLPSFVIVSLATISTCLIGSTCVLQLELRSQINSWRWQESNFPLILAWKEKYALVDNSQANTSKAFFLLYNAEFSFWVAAAQIFEGSRVGLKSRKFGWQMKSCVQLCSLSHTHTPSDWPDFPSHWSHGGSIDPPTSSVSAASITDSARVASIMWLAARGPRTLVEAHLMTCWPKNTAAMTCMQLLRCTYNYPK